MIHKSRSPLHYHNRQVKKKYYVGGTGTSYLVDDVLIRKDSISMGTASSYILFPTVLPKRSITSIVSDSHLSSMTDRTLLTWTPKLRWIPEHSIQTIIPRLVQAHSGSLTPQSAHLSFPGIMRIFFNDSRFLSSPCSVFFCAWLNVDASTAV